MSLQYINTPLCLSCQWRVISDYCQIGTADADSLGVAQQAKQPWSWIKTKQWTFDLFLACLRFLIVAVVVFCCLFICLCLLFVVDVFCCSSCSSYRFLSRGWHTWVVNQPTIFVEAIQDLRTFASTREPPWWARTGNAAWPSRPWLRVGFLWEIDLDIKSHHCF